MAPSLSASEETVKVKLLKAKISDALKNNGILEELDDIIMHEPEHLVGEHMATASWYVEVKFQDSSLKSKHLFMKKFFNNPSQIAMAKDLKVMDKESSFYQDFLPAARKFYENRTGIKNSLPFFPKCLYSDDEIVLLENVVLNDGFEMLPNLDKQDLNTTKHVLRNLAIFHATSFAMIKDCGLENFKERWALNVSESLFSGHKNPFISNMLENAVRVSVNILKSNCIPGRQNAVETLEKLVGKTNDDAGKCLSINSADKIYALNHGDCWNNNMLFKLDPNSKTILDHMFIDLQVTRIGSPNLDIGYFLYTSVKANVRRASLKEILEEYFQEFNSTCDTLKTELPMTFQEFFDDFRDKCKLGFYFSLMSITATEALKDMDLGSLAGKNDPKALDDMFNTTVGNWIARNPQKAAQMTIDIVAVVEEYENLTTNKGN